MPINGFIPIGNFADNNKRFLGNFDGQGYEIKNIYINTNKNAGLFGTTYNATIQNLGVTGEITSTGQQYAGGITGNGVSTNYYNCYNQANISGKNRTGGILGTGSGSMVNCYNTGEVISFSGYAGGLAAGYANKISNCKNTGNVISKNNYAGGIIAQSSNTITITNSYNSGEITSNGCIASGIVANVYGQANVNNCYNIGKIVATTGVSYAGVAGIGATKASNCYTIGQLTSNTLQNKVIGAETIKNCYYNSSSLATNGKIEIEEGAVDIANKTAEEFVTRLNSYQDDTGSYPKDWKKWTLGKEGYPIWEE